MITRFRRVGILDLPRLFLFCMALLPALHTATAGSAGLRFRKLVDLPRSGLRLKLMPDSTETPPPSPSAGTFERVSNGKREVIEMYDGRDIWKLSQYAGSWLDENQNALTLVEVTTPMPEEFRSKKFRPKEQCEQLLTEASSSNTTWKADDVANWIADFMGAPSAATRQVPKRPSNLRDLVEITVPDQTKAQVHYAFRLSRSAAGQSRAPQNWFVALFELNSSGDLARGKKEILEDFFPNATCSKTTASSDSGPSKKFQNSETIVSKNKSPEFIASRKQVADSIKNMKDWWFVETESFIILSNLGSKYRSMMKDLQVNIETVRNSCELMIPPPKPISAVSVVRVFATPEEYEAYVPPEVAWSGGLWFGEKRELVIRSIDWGSSSDKKSQVLRATYHESLHQYLFYALDRNTPAPWFNEGFASLVENATVRNDGLRFQEGKEAAKLIADLAKRKVVPLNGILRMSYEDFYAGAQTERQINYATAWALVYYLHKGIAIEKSSPYSGILSAYVDALMECHDPDEATEIVFKSVNMQKLEDDFRKFWRSSGKRSAAQRNLVPGERK